MNQKKIRINLTVDQEIDFWLRTTDYNRSELVNDFLTSLMKAEQNLSADEEELESEIGFHQQKMMQHKEDWMAKKAVLARLQAERDRERSEQLEKVLEAADFVSRMRR